MLSDKALTPCPSYYVGKFMNAYGKDNYNAPYPEGWTDSSFLVDPWTYNYYNSRWTTQGAAALTSEAGTHTTLVTERKALDFIDDAVDTGGQFFLMVSSTGHNACIRHLLI